MSKITSQANLKAGLSVIDEELAPSSAGRVSDKGMHIPDVGMIDGKNTLPTVAGYTSYFGASNAIEDTPLEQQIQELLTYKTLKGDTISIAFCAEGLFVRSLAGDAVSVLTNVPAAGDDPEYDKLDLVLGKGKWLEIIATIPIASFKMWSYVLMENHLYCFQKGMDFICKITAYQPGQIIFEHLSPTYILSSRERHTFTYTLEDDSTGDDTYKEVQITTDTGLDFGQQRVRVDTAADVSRAIESWEGAFAASGFFATKMTETLRAEVAIDATIPIDQTFINIQQIVTDTIHDGTPEELTLEAVDSTDLVLPADSIDSHLVRIDLPAPYDIDTSFALWSISGTLTGAVAGSVRDLIPYIGNLLPIPSVATDRAYDIIVTKTSNNNVESGVYRRAYMEFVVEVYRQGADTTFGLTCTEGSVSISVTSTLSADTRRYGGAVTSDWEAEFITGTTYWDWPYSFYDDPATIGSPISDTEDRIVALLTDYSSQYTSSNAHTLIVGQEPTNIAHISTAVHEFGGAKYRLRYGFTTVDHGWGFNRGQIDGGYLQPIYPQDMERVAAAYSTSTNFNYLSTMASGSPLVGHLFLPAYDLTTKLTLVSWAITFTGSAGESYPVYTIPLGTEIYSAIEALLGYMVSTIAGIDVLYSNSLRLDTTYGGDYWTELQIFFQSDQAVSTNQLAYDVVYAGAVSGTMAGWYLDYDSGGPWELYAGADPEAICNKSRVRIEGNLNGGTITVNGYTTPTISMTYEMWLFPADIPRSTTVLTELQVIVDAINTNASGVLAEVRIGRLPYSPSGLALAAIYVVDDTPMYQRAGDYYAPDVQVHIDPLGASNGYLTRESFDGLSAAGNSPASDYSFGQLQASMRPIATKGIRVTGFKKDYPTVVSYNGAARFLAYHEDSNTLATHLHDLYSLDATIGASIGSLVTDQVCTADLHYTMEVTFTLGNATPVPSSAEAQDGTSVFTEDSHTQLTLPMGHIEGIASGRSRLIAWDEDDIIYWSAASDLVDFIPSPETGANQISVPAIKGKIVKCEGYTNGFVIYCTGNAVIAAFSKSATSMYSFKPVVDSEGLVDYRHLASAKDIHYYWSSKGLIALDPASSKIGFIAEEMTDWIKKHRYPILVQLLSNRFMVLYLQDRNISFSNRDARNGGSLLAAGIDPVSLTSVSFEYVSPGASLYPTYNRALIYDIQLKKWGSCDVPCKLLASLTPFNQAGYQLSKNYQLMSSMLDNEQRELVIRTGDGYTRLVDTNPTDSYVLFGHYATHRENMTKLVEIETEFVEYPEAEIEIEKSLDGAKVDFTQNVSREQLLLTDRQGFNLAGKWFNILIKGQYHLKRLLVKGYTYGRR